jgi:hypothetical protein
MGSKDACKLAHEERRRLTAILADQRAAPSRLAAGGRGGGERAPVVLRVNDRYLGCYRLAVTDGHLMAAAYSRTSGRCLRCREAFAPEQLVVMVREHLIAEVFLNGGCT